MSEWETFCDNRYFDLWRVRRKNERGFDDGYHLQHGAEAKELVELLNRLERERDEVIRKGVETRNEVNELAAVINELTAVVKGLRVIMRQEGEK
jgi:hypothetical protein